MFSFVKRVLSCLMIMMLMMPVMASAQQTRRCSYQCINSSGQRAPANVTQPGTCTVNADCRSECLRVCQDSSQSGVSAPSFCDVDSLICTGGGGGSVGGVYDPFAGQDVPGVIGSIIRFLLGFVGALFLAMFVYGGILWFSAAGDENQVKSAKKTLTNAVLGMVIVMLSYAIVAVFLQYITTINPLESDSTVRQAEQQGAQTNTQTTPSQTPVQAPPSLPAPSTPAFPLPEGQTAICSGSNCQVACQASCPTGTNPDVCSQGCSFMCNGICDRLPASPQACIAQCPSDCAQGTTLGLTFGSSCSNVCQTSCNAAVRLE